MKACWLGMWAIVGLCTIAGCGGGDETESVDDAAEEQVERAPSTIKRRELDSLAKVGSYLPPLDEGRVEVAPPSGWRPLPRDSKYLARFVQEEANELPRIVALVDDSPSPEVSEANAENIGELIKPLTAEAKKGKRKVVEPVRPIALGDRVFARHVRIARFNDEPCAIVSLQTVSDSRLYTFELYVPAGSDGSEYAKFVKQHQDAVYATAGRMKLKGDSDAASEPEPTATGEPAGTEEPAAEAP